MSKDLPNFAAWQYENLVNYAKDAYLKLQEQNEQLEQARLDFKGAMELLREHLRKQYGNS
jgi:hypothetical protein